MFVQAVYLLHGDLNPQNILCEVRSAAVITREVTVPLAHRDFRLVASPHKESGPLLKCPWNHYVSIRRWIMSPECAIESSRLWDIHPDWNQHPNKTFGSKNGQVSRCALAILNFHLNLAPLRSPGSPTGGARKVSRKVSRALIRQRKIARLEPNITGPFIFQFGNLTKPEIPPSSCSRPEPEPVLPHVKCQMVMEMVRKNGKINSEVSNGHGNGEK